MTKLTTIVAVFALTLSIGFATPIGRSGACPSACP
jgi:hypothetical protein